MYILIMTILLSSGSGVHSQTTQFQLKFSSIEKCQEAAKVIKEEQEKQFNIGKLGSIGNHSFVCLRE